MHRTARPTTGLGASESFGSTHPATFRRCGSRRYLSVSTCVALLLPLLTLKQVVVIFSVGLCRRARLPISVCDSMTVDGLRGRLQAEGLVHFILEPQRKLSPDDCRRVPSLGIFHTYSP